MPRNPWENPVVQELQSNLLQDNVLTADEKRAFAEAYAKDKFAVITASRDRQWKLRDFILKDIRANVEQAIWPENIRLSQKFFNARNAQKNKDEKRNIPMIAEDAIFWPDVMKQVVSYQEDKGLPITWVLDAQLLAQIVAESSQLKWTQKVEIISNEIPNPRKTIQPVVELKVPKWKVLPAEVRAWEALTSEERQVINWLEKHTLANLRSALWLDRSDKPFDPELQKAVKFFQEQYNLWKYNWFWSLFWRYTPPDTLLNKKWVPDKRTLTLIFALKNPPSIPF